MSPADLSESGIKALGHSHSPSHLHRKGYGVVVKRRLDGGTDNIFIAFVYERA